VQIPDPRRHLVRYYGACSNASRGKHKKTAARPSPPPHRAALRRRWAELIHRVYEVDPLICPRCGSEMRVSGFVTQPALIDRILDHLRRRDKIPRPPPLSAQRLATPLEIRPARRSQAARNGRRIGPSSVPSLHATLGAHFPQGPGASWPSPPPGSRPGASARPPRPSREPRRARPQKEVPIPLKEQTDAS